MAQDLTFWNLFFALVPLFCITLLGSWFRHQQFMEIGADSTIQWLLLNLFTPCLILDTFLGNPALSNISDIIIAPVLGFCTLVLGLLLGKPVAKAVGIHKVESINSFAVSAAVYNYGYIPIPLILIFFNKAVLSMLFLFNIGLETAMWTVGILTITGKKVGTGTLRQIIRPPLVMVVISLIANFFFKESPLPFSAARIVHMLGQATVPVAFLLVGAMIYDDAHHLRSLHPLRPVVAGVLLRLLILPLCFVAIAVFVPIPQELRTVLCVQASMPSGVLPIVLIRHHGGDLQMALRIIVSTSVLCLITMPIWLLILSRWMG